MLPTCHRKGCLLQVHKRRLCIQHWEALRRAERTSYYRHRKDRIAYAKKWISEHYQQVLQYNRERKRWRTQHDPQYLERKREKGRMEYRKYRAKKAVHNAAQVHTKEQRARTLLNLAIHSGKMVRPRMCEACNATKFRIDGHHHQGYKNPYNVIWLCRPCHAKVHR